MKESVLKQYFDGEIGVLSLKPFLSPVRDVSKLTKGDNFDCDLSDEYQLSLKDLRKVCDDYLAGSLDEADVVAIAFFLLAADHFVWDKTTESGAVVAEVIDDWNSPEIDFPITRRNMKRIARGLDEGIYDPQALSTDE